MFPSTRPSILRVLVLTIVFISVLVLVASSFSEKGRSVWQRPLNNPQSHDEQHQQHDDDKPTPSHELPIRPDDRFDPRCSAFPDTGNVVIAVKTGATEASEKIPLQMQTSLRCAQNVVVFSDMEQELGEYHVYDALDAVPDSAMEGNTDFDFYKKQQSLKSAGMIDSLMKGAKDPRMPNDLAAWTLDKYKQLHMLEKTWGLYPDRDWYIFIDADTYVIWPNLIQWLKTMNPAEKIYTGSMAQWDKVKFAHGGSGITLSGALLHAFAVEHNGTASDWDVKMHEECCGDYVIGKIFMDEHNVLLKNVWPTVNGEKPTTIPFGNTHWCQPVVTMHHVQPPEMAEMDVFERGRNDAKRPVTFSEIFTDLVLQSIPEKSYKDWDNLADDVKGHADSWDICKSGCEDDPDCLTYSWDGDECAIGKTKIRIGAKRVDEAGKKKWRSGWNKTRIEEWVGRQEPCDLSTFKAGDEKTR
ncbi:glycosyltransferase family 31 protein [Aulographum hederae CBS 113979]|uniref:N-acetylgalactosaminide beta-1,3-galactosyltransferase n=1 Tax=Aulographum hederae CBS 113979 TaxID=1176131 RepID=A0A6G1GNI1_9PEZI|nr:glycosyltransferase family 31 protein [Aulographum hederae CBS 113979]